MSTIFEWNQQEMYKLLDSCDSDDMLEYIWKYSEKNHQILESGCGLCRWVKFLSTRGYDITGLEFSQKTLEMVAQEWPDLKTVTGDVLCNPFKDDTFDLILSVGVVEHFEEGPNGPLKDLHRILKPGGVAIISTPCFNTLRKYKYKLKRVKNSKYAVWPVHGDFYEYRFTREELLKEIKDAGLEIVEYAPISHIDGVYHDLNPREIIMKFQGWEFRPTIVATSLNRLLTAFPYFHNHMMLVVARKPTR